jgi:hypothetical protein
MQSLAPSSRTGEPGQQISCRATAGSSRAPLGDEAAVNACEPSFGHPHRPASPRIDGRPDTSVSRIPAAGSIM